MPGEPQTQPNNPFGTPRRAAAAALAYVAAGAFGIILIATGDWVPGTVILVAAIIGLCVLIAVTRRLRRDGLGHLHPRGGPPR